MSEVSYLVDPLASRGDPGIKVVVVENDKHLLRLYEVNIALWPLTTHFMGFSNGHAALAHLGRETPDLLIVDLIMPGLDGFALINTLCRASDMHATKIVVVSSLDQYAIAQITKLPASIDVLSKPIAFAKLLDIATDVHHTKAVTR